MSAQHTKGSWSLNGNLIEGPDGETIAYITAYSRLTPKQKANARLIAAAPELLGALKRAKRHLSVYSEEFDMAEQAIAKVEGGAA